MFSRFATLLVLAWSFLTVSASIKFIAPSADYWWIANSQNLYSWTCGNQFNEGYTNFTLIITNDDQKILPGPLAIVAIQWDYACSVLIQTSAVTPAAANYQLHFADVFNQTHILASSDKFEIKPQGSTYAPTPSGAAPATVTASVTGSANATGASATATATHSGASMQSFAVWTVVGSALALVATSLMF